MGDQAPSGHTEPQMTDKKLAANKRNALASTGPKTEEGKRRSSMNAVRHGLRSVSLAVPHLESPEDWEAHRTLTVASLAAVGYMETLLAERAAALLWRLGRAVRYEAEMVSLWMEAATGAGVTETSLNSLIASPVVSLEDLEDSAEYLKEVSETLFRVSDLKGKAKVSGKDAVLVLDEAADYFEVFLYEGQEDVVELGLPGVPDGSPWEDWTGWTRDLVDLGVQRIAAAGRERHPEWNETVRTDDPWRLVTLNASMEATAARKQYEARVAAREADLRKRLLPEDGTMEKVTRYEAHLERSLFRTLHELQRLQAARGEGVGPVPAVLDVDVNVHGGDA